MPDRKEILFAITYLVLTLPFLALLSPVTVYSQRGNFVTLNLAGGISLDVPRRWTFLNNDIKNAISASSEALIDFSRLNYPKTEQIILVAANGYSTMKEASATIRLSVRPKQTASQSDVQQLNKEEIESVGSEQRKEITRMLRLSDPRTQVNWVSTSVIPVNGLHVITMEYIRVPADRASFRVHVDLILASSRIVALTTSYYEDEGLLWRPIIERMRNSIKLK